MQSFLITRNSEVTKEKGDIPSYMIFLDIFRLKNKVNKGKPELEKIYLTYIRQKINPII